MLCTGHNHIHTGYLLVDITYFKKLCYISLILKRRHKFSQSLATAQSDITKICPSNLVPFHHYRWKTGCFFGWHPIKLWRGRLILLIWSGLDSMFKSMLVINDFLALLLISWRLCHIWIISKFNLTYFFKDHDDVDIFQRHYHNLILWTQKHSQQYQSW